MKTVVLDAGHGGKDSGAVGNGRKEKDDVLKLTLAVGKILDDYVDVEYTRKTDIYESVKKKAADGNAYKADLFVSFHRNSSEFESSNGYESLVYSDSGMAGKLANYINLDMKKIGFRNRGTKIRKDLSVLRRTNMPAMLGEFGFITNKYDNKMFIDKFDQIAKAVADDILEVLGVSTKKLTVKVKNGKVITKTSPLNMRQKAKSTAKVVAKVPKGKMVYILKVGDKWHKVKYNGKTGYCAAKYIKIL